MDGRWLIYDMLDMGALSGYVASVAGFITSLGVIVGAIYKWIWKPYIKKKMEAEEKHRQDTLDIISEVGKPIFEQITSLEEQTKRHAEMDDKLTEIANQNIRIIDEIRHEFEEHNRGADERDMLIRQNVEILKNQQKRLDSHSDRILILETVTGLVHPTRQKIHGKEDSDEVE